MKLIKSTIILLFLFISSYVFAEIQMNNLSRGSILVKIEGVSNSKGKVRVFIYDSEEKFLKKELKEISTPIEDINEITVTFKDLSEGIYAIYAYHDENDNSEMDKNWLGIPSEDYGFSNNARGTMGPAEYEDAKFIFKGSESTILINIE